MINIDAFTKRIEVLLDYFGLSASAFADKLGVQRSGLSHLMSGRNKPSLDLVMKITESFPEVDLYWLLNGDGQFPKGDDAPTALNQNVPKPISNETDVKQPAVQDDLFFVSNDSKNTFSQNADSVDDGIQENKVENNSNEIERIVVFYKNGTFKSYNPDK
jgi:transcriptional regulator with XRE-family HTH domain